MTWPQAALGDIVEIVSGATPKTGIAEYWDGDIQWVTPADLGKLTGPFVDVTPRSITQSGLSSCAATVLPAQSVLLSSRAPIGHVAINSVPMATNQGFKSLIPRQEIADAKYLYHWLKANVGYLQTLGNGATFKELSKSTVSRIKVPLPPVVEQRRIAAILDYADALCTNRTKVLGRLDILTQSIFFTSFGDPIKDVRYPISPLEEWVDAVRPITYGILKPGPDTPDGVPYVRVADMKHGGIHTPGVRKTTPTIAHEYRRSQLVAGDLLVSIRGHVGRFAFVPPELAGGNITQDSARLAVTNPASAIYVRTALESPSLQRWMARRTKGAAVTGINLGDLRQAPIPRPPMPIQVKFAEAVAAASTASRLGRAQLTHLMANRESLRSRAFTGQL